MEAKDDRLGKFSNLCQIKLNQNNIETAENFTETRKAITNESPKTQRQKRRKGYWFDDGCKEVIILSIAAD